jgi:hypothetical protein
MNQTVRINHNLPERWRNQQGGAGGCVIGCLVAVALVVLVIALLAYFAMSTLEGMIDEFTDTEPMELPEPTLGEEETAAVWERLEAFKTDIEAGKEPDPLELTGPELNALLQFVPLSEGGRPWIHVDIEDNRLVGEVSLNVGQFIPGGFAEGRYFNGTAQLDVSMHNNLMYVYAEKASVKGEPVPDDVMGRLSNVNLAEQMAADPEVRAYMQMIESVKVEDGVLKIVPESNTIKTAPEPADPAPEPANP